jgi:outer membrane murein-binding lipoprotein Lpp
MRKIVIAGNIPEDVSKEIKQYFMKLQSQVKHITSNLSNSKQDKTQESQHKLRRLEIKLKAMKKKIIAAKTELGIAKQTLHYKHKMVILKQVGFTSSITYSSLLVA